MYCVCHCRLWALLYVTGVSFAELHAGRNYSNMNCFVSIFHFCLKLKPRLNYVAVNDTFFGKLLLVLNCDYYWYYYYYYLEGNSAVEKRRRYAGVIVRTAYTGINTHRLK